MLSQKINNYLSLFTLKKKKKSVFQEDHLLEQGERNVGNVIRRIIDKVRLIRGN